jgi:hypothetical protein
MLARATPIRNTWQLGGFLVVGLVIACRCPTTPHVAAEGPQSLQRALNMGAAGGAGPGQGAPVCFHGVETDSQAPYDACLDAGEHAQQQLRGPLHRISQGGPTGCLPVVTNIMRTHLPR